MEEPVTGPPVQTLGPVAATATASIALRPWQVSIGGSEAVVRPPDWDRAALRVVPPVTRQARKPAVPLGDDGRTPRGADGKGKVVASGFWVSVRDFSEPATVGVLAHAAIGVPRSATLLRKINELNVASGVPTFYWSGGLVVDRPRC